MRADYHVHTSFSDDSRTPMEDMILRGLELGLQEIAFTEHVDYGVKTDENCPYAAYAETLSRLREKYRGKITLRKGIEFGVQAHTVPLYQRDFKEQGFDFVILSNHQVGDKEFWNGAFQEGKSQEEYQREYYQALYDVTGLYKDYSVLGHLDLIKRYDPQGDYPDEKILEAAEQIFRRAIGDGKGIEVNTSCFRYRLKDLTPSKRLLKLYKDVGGEILTLGSDAHAPEYLADRMDDVRQVLKEIGFRYFCTFENMEPQYHPL